MNYKDFSSLNFQKNEKQISNYDSTNSSDFMIIHKKDLKDQINNDIKLEFRHSFQGIFNSNDPETYLEIFSKKIAKSEYKLFSVFDDGTILNELLKAFEAKKIKTSRLVLEIYIELLKNSKEFSSFVTHNSGIFTELLHENYLIPYVLDLFSLAVYDIPDFNVYLHSIKIYELIFISLNRIQSEQQTNNKAKKRKNILIMSQSDKTVRSISKLLYILSKNNQILSPIYQSNEEKSNVFNQLCYISHFLLFYGNNDYIAKTSLLIIQHLCTVTIFSLNNLLDENLSSQIFKFLEKGWFIEEISGILCSLIKYSSVDALNFIENFGILMPLVRHAHNNVFKWFLLPVFISLAEMSDEISENLFECEILLQYNDNFDGLQIYKKEMILKLFCVLAKASPKDAINLNNLDTFIQNCNDYLDEDNDSLIYILPAFYSLILYHIDFSNYIDIKEFTENLNRIVCENENETIRAIGQQILNEI